MSGRLSYDEVRHDCEPPDVPEVGGWGETHQVVARWRCDECGTRWRLEANFMLGNRFYWERSSQPSWRWRRAERRRLRARASTPTGDPRAESNETTMGGTP